MNVPLIRLTVLLLASWTTFLLRFVPYQTVQRCSPWNQEATDHRDFSVITFPRLAPQLQYPLNCQSHTSVPIWWFLACGRQRTLTRYSWTSPHQSVGRSLCASQARLVNTAFAQEEIARTLLERTRSTTPSLIATQRFGRSIQSKLPFIERLHRGRNIASVPSRSYRQSHRIVSPNISLHSFMTSSKRRANQLATSQTSLWPPSHPSIRHHPTCEFLNSSLGTG